MKYKMLHVISSAQSLSFLYLVVADLISCSQRDFTSWKLFSPVRNTCQELQRLRSAQSTRLMIRRSQVRFRSWAKYIYQHQGQPSIKILVPSGPRGKHLGAPQRKTQGPHSETSRGSKRKHLGVPQGNIQGPHRETSRVPHSETKTARTDAGVPISKCVCNRNVKGSSTSHS